MEGIKNNLFKGFSEADLKEAVVISVLGQKETVCTDRSLSKLQSDADGV